MADGIRLGNKPEFLRVLLTAGSDFITTLRVDDPWPAGTSVTLVVGADTWTASIVGTDATFTVDKATADAVADGTAVRLVYTNGSTDQVWARGTVVRFDD